MVLNGLISADGANSSATGGGGGAGGAVYLSCTGLLSGSGKLRANGGGGSWSTTNYGGGGAGGRIGVWYISSNFTGTMEVKGAISSYQLMGSIISAIVGAGGTYRSAYKAANYQRAGGGTISVQRMPPTQTSVAYREVVAGNQRVQATSTRATISLALSDTAFRPYASTPPSGISTNGSLRGVDRLLLGRGCTLTLTDYIALNVSKVISGGNGAKLLLQERATLRIPQNFSVVGYKLEIQKGSVTGGGNITVTSGGALALHNTGKTLGATSWGTYVFKSLTVGQNSSVELMQGSAVNVSGITLRANSISVQRTGKIHSDKRGRRQKL